MSATTPFLATSRQREKMNFPLSGKKKIDKLPLVDLLHLSETSRAELALNQPENRPSDYGLRSAALNENRRIFDRDYIDVKRKC